MGVYDGHGHGGGYGGEEVDRGAAKSEGMGVRTTTFGWREVFVINLPTYGMFIGASTISVDGPNGCSILVRLLVCLFSLDCTVAWFSLPCDGRAVMSFRRTWIPTACLRVTPMQTDGTVFTVDRSVHRKNEWLRPTSKMRWVAPDRCGVTAFVILLCSGRDDRVSPRESLLSLDDSICCGTGTEMSRPSYDEE